MTVKDLYFQRNDWCKENLGYTSECYEKDINRMPDGIDELCGGTGEL